jgi:hypothetical protein
VSPILAAGMLTYGGDTTGERSDWHGESVDADDIYLGRTCDVSVGRVFLIRVCFRVGCARTASLEAVKQTGGKNGLQAGASPFRRQHGVTNDSDKQPFLGCDNPERSRVLLVTTQATCEAKHCGTRREDRRIKWCILLTPFVRCHSSCRRAVHTCRLA